MKPVSLSFCAAVALLFSPALNAQIINIDFLAQRGAESQSSNYSGEGYAGGGTTFNGIVANDASESDYITASGSNLETASGASTSASFSISQVGADNQTNSSTLGVLPGNGSYLFINSANNVATSVDFTISGLGTATEATLYFYTSNTSDLNDSVFSVGGTKVTPSTNGIYNSSNTEEFISVPISGGTISGTFALPAAFTGPNNPVLLSGLTIEIPEPSTWALMGLAGAFLLLRAARWTTVI